MPRITKNGSATVRRAAPAKAVPSAQKLSVNVSGDIAKRLKRLAFEQQLSESSIVEVALQLLFGRSSDATLGTQLREHGATLRRRSVGN
jgi:hypothetical protein